jgi:hypothetical protein
LSEGPSTLGGTFSDVSLCRFDPSAFMIHSEYPEFLGQHRVKTMCWPSGVNAGPSSKPLPSEVAWSSSCRPVPSALTCQMPWFVKIPSMKIAVLPSGDQFAMKWSSHASRGKGPAKTISFVSSGLAATSSHAAAVFEPHLDTKMQRANRMRPFFPGTTAPDDGAKDRDHPGHQADRRHDRDHALT